jgi:hypothetical protein
VHSPDKPWGLGERFDRAKNMLREGHSIEEIQIECALESFTIRCIKQKHFPDYSTSAAFASLRKNMKDD